MLLDITLRQPYAVGSEAYLERIQNFVDALHEACEKFELEEARRGIAQCAAEREQEKVS